MEEENGRVLKVEINNLNRRLDESLTDRREMWKSQGQIDQSVARSHERMDGFERTADRIEKTVDDLRSSMTRWFAGLAGILVAAAVTIALAVHG